MAVVPDADTLPPWLIKAIAKLHQTLSSLGPEMAPLLAAGSFREKAIARLLEERQPLLRECFRRLPATIERCDLGRYVIPGVLSTLLQKSHEQFCLIVLLSPPQVSASCPRGLRFDLRLELVEELRESVRSTCHRYSIEFYGDLVRLPLSDTGLATLHGVLFPLPTLILSSTLTDNKLYWHLSFWFHARQSLTTCALLPWSWAESYEANLSAGHSERQSLCHIRREIIRGHQLMLHLVAMWYFAHLQPIVPEEGVGDTRGWPDAIATDWQNLIADISSQRQQRQQAQHEEYLHSARRCYTRLAPSARSYHLTQTLPTPRCTVYGLVLCPEKNWLILGGGERILKIVLIAEERTLIYLTGHGGDVLSLAINQTRHLLASSSSEGVVQVWNLKNLQLIHRFTHTGEPIRSLSFDHDGRFLAGISLGQGMWVWDMWQGNTFRQWQLGTSGAGAIAFHRNQQSLWVALQEGGLARYAIASEEIARPVPTPPLRFLLLSPDGSTLASYDRQGQGYLLDSSSGAIRHCLPPTRQGLSSLAFDPSGNVIAGGDKSGAIYLWDVTFGQLLHSFPAHDHPISALAFDSHNRLASGSSWQQPVRIWQFSEGFETRNSPAKT